MTLCQIEERDAGRSYPRTCPTCGLSKTCAKGLDRKSQADRITALEAQLQIVLDRESATTARYDAKLDAIEAQVAAADRLADAIDSDHGYCGDADPLCPICIERAAYRAAKGE